MSQNPASENLAFPSLRAGHLEGLRTRIIASIVGPIAWLCFTLLYVGFWAQGFSLFQSIIVILVSALILAGVMGALWTAWGMSRARPWSVP